MQRCKHADNPFVPYYFAWLCNVSIRDPTMPGVHSSRTLAKESNSTVSYLLQDWSCFFVAFLSFSTINTDSFGCQQAFKGKKEQTRARITLKWLWNDSPRLNSQTVYTGLPESRSLAATMNDIINPFVPKYLKNTLAA